MNYFLQTTDGILDISTLLFAAAGTVWFALRERSRRRSTGMARVRSTHHYDRGL